MNEKRKDFSSAMEGYMHCLSECTSIGEEPQVDASDKSGEAAERRKKYDFLRELRGEVMLRIAVLRKEMGALDQAMLMCNNVASENFSESIRANALCLKVPPLS